MFLNKAQKQYVYALTLSRHKDMGRILLAHEENKART